MQLWKIDFKIKTQHVSHLNSISLGVDMDNSAS